LLKDTDHSYKRNFKLTISQVKIFCGEMITNSNYSKDKKLKLLELIKNSTENQLVEIMKKFIVRKPTKKELTEAKKYFIRNKLLQEKKGPVGSVGGMSVYSMPTWMAWRNLKGLLQTRTLQCKQIDHINKRRLCLDQAQVALFESQLKLLKTIITDDCPLNDDVDGCRRKGIQMTRNVQDKLDRQLQRSKARQQQGLYEY
jgi:hypothetical protein